MRLWYKVIVDRALIGPDVYPMGHIIEVEFYNDDRLGLCMVVEGPYSWANSVVTDVGELSYWIHDKKLLAPC